MFLVWGQRDLTLSIYICGSCYDTSSNCTFEAGHY